MMSMTSQSSCIRGVSLLAVRESERCACAAPPPKSRSALRVSVSIHRKTKVEVSAPTFQGGERGGQKPGLGPSSKGLHLISSLFFLCVCVFLFLPAPPPSPRPRNVFVGKALVRRRFSRREHAPAAAPRLALTGGVYNMPRPPRSMFELLSSRACLSSDSKIKAVM